MAPHHPDILAIAVGNSRTRMGRCVSGGIESPALFRSDDTRELARAARELAEGAGAVVIASVNEPCARALENELGSAIPCYRLGRDLSIPIQHALDDASTVGHDRLLCAIGAFEKARQACVVVDAGTAITVDFVDGEGVFQGGAIAPGLSMMLRSMTAGTSALPDIAFEPVPLDRPFGKRTIEAMRLGAQASAVGAVHHLLGRYAEAFGAYPVVIATGGDAPTLFEGDEIVEHIVPDLQLLGIRAACAIVLDDEIDDDQDDPGDSPRERL